MKKALALLAGVFCLSSWNALAQQPALDDAQIMEILTQANDVDIANGKLAQKNASNPDVKGFAQRMITDHQQSNDSGKALAKQLKIKPQSSPISDGLKASGKDAMKSLKDLKGADFDQAYVKNEIAVHQMVLDTIDKDLMPNAKSDDVKTLLTKTRPVIASHLEHAKKLQATLGKSAS